MEPIVVIKDVNFLAELKNKTIVVETEDITQIEQIKNAVEADNHLFCIKLMVNQNITSLVYKGEWEKIPLVVYTEHGKRNTEHGKRNTVNGTRNTANSTRNTEHGDLGAVRDLIGWLPLLKKLNIKFFLDGGKEQNYEAVQILSSLGIYSGIVINEDADWEKLTDLMYYALCGKVPHAPIEPFQFVYDRYERNILVDYGRVFFNDAKNSWQRFFYEPTACAACAGWRICLGKYATLKDKSGCQHFTNEWLNLIENLKFKI
jgi:hypothetical protein